MTLSYHLSKTCVSFTCEKDAEDPRAYQLFDGRIVLFFARKFCTLHFKKTRKNFRKNQRGNKI